MTKIAHSLAIAAGHVTAPYIAAIILAALYLSLGIEVTNFAISVISLLLLFILQSSQERDGHAIQAKLDALLKGVPDAPTDLARIEQLTIEEIEERREHI